MKSLTVKDLICRYLSSFCGAWISRSHRAKGVMSDYSLVKVGMCSHFWSPLLCTFIREQDRCKPRLISRDVCEQDLYEQLSCLCMYVTFVQFLFSFPAPCFASCPFVVVVVVAVVACKVIAMYCRASMVHHHYISHSYKLHFWEQLHVHGSNHQHWPSLPLL